MRTAKALAALALVAALALGTADSIWAQCAMCKTALTNSPEGQQMARGFNNAILFLLGAPYLVFGSLAASLWAAHRRKGQDSKARLPRLS